MPKVEWPLHIYRGYLERMAAHQGSDQLLGNKYMEGVSSGYKGALEALDMHVLPCSCDICINKRVGEIDTSLSTENITVFKPEVGRLSCSEPNVILDPTAEELYGNEHEMDGYPQNKEGEKDETGQ